MATAKYIGVFTCNTWPSKGMFAAGRKYNWFVWEDGWGRYRAQLLDAAFQPLDNPRTVTAAEFKTHFKSQPHILITPVSQLEVGTPEEEARRQAQEIEEARRVRRDIAELSEKLGIEVEVRGEDDVLPEPAGQGGPGERGAQSGRAGMRSIAKYGPRAGAEAPAPHTEPTFETDEQAARLDDESRTAFVLAITRWRRGDKQAAMDTFQQLLKLQEGIVPAHKHMYTDFAINLRKCALNTLAKEFYRRTVQLAPEDCNARFNLARIHFENGEIHNALKELDEALRLEPIFPFAMQFQEFLIKNYPGQAKSFMKSRKAQDPSADSGDSGGGNSSNGGNFAPISLNLN